MLVHGHVSTITALLPWSNFWSGDITLKVHGLRLTLKPVNEKRDKKSFTAEEEESPIMSSSLHFADDFLKTEMEPDQNKELYESIQQLHEAEKTEVDFGLEGLHVLTRVIDKMLAKVKVDITDTIIRIMHPSAVSLAADPQRINVDREYALDIEVPKMSYFDESPCFTDKTTTVLTSKMTESSTLLPNPGGDEIIKIIMITSPKIWMKSIDNNYSSTATTTATNPHDDEIILNSKDDFDDTGGLSQTEFYEASEGDSNIFYNNISTSPHSSFMSGSATPRAYSFQSLPNTKPYEALLFTTMNKENWIRYKTKATSPFDIQSTTSTTSKSSSMNSIDIYFSHIRTMITPKQLSFLLELFTAIPADSPNTTAAPSANEQLSNKSYLGREEMFRNQNRSSGVDSLSPHSVLKDIESYQQQIQHPHSTNVPVVNPQVDPQVDPKHQIASSSQIPNVKIKLQIPVIDMYVLYDDSLTLSPAIWESTLSPPTTKTSHIKFWINQLIIRLQFFSQHQQLNRKKNINLVAGSTLPHFDKHFQYTTPPLKKRSSFVLSSILDARIQSMGMGEWVAESQYFTMMAQKNSTSSTPSLSIRMKYNHYNPILEFTDLICNDYDDNHIFPSYSSSSESNNFAAHHENNSKSKKDVIRIKIEKYCKAHSSRYDDGTFYNQDINADVQALKVTLDPKIIDRLENYVYAFLTSQKLSSKTDIKKNEQSSFTEQPLDQKIYEDLNKVSNEYQHHIQAKVKFSLIRLVLYAPDMSQSNTRDEFNDLYHGDILSVDVKKITTSWKTDHSISQTEKIAVDLDRINVFLKFANDDIFKCWFTAKSRENNNLSSATSLLPSMEISLRSSTINAPYTTSSARSCFFGTGSDIPNNLFEHLSRNEAFYCEQKVNAPMEEQAESAMVFKQRTVETSTIVVNCHFPITYMSLPKKTWDKVQIIQNDLLLWQPRFIRHLEQNQQDNTNSSMAGSINSELFNPPSSNRRYSDISTNSINQLRASSIFSQSFDQLHEPQSIQQKSNLLSLVAVMSEGIWNLQTTSKDKKEATYQLQFSDFRYFTVVNHLGKNENITTLDIENLSLDDITNAAHRIPLINKAIPKSLIPKRNTSMVSILSRLTSIPELNKQNKLTSVVACNICWRFSPDVTFLDNLIGFQKAPEDLVFIDPPTQYIKVFAHVLDTALDYKPLNIPSRAVVVLDNLQVITDILAGRPLLDVKTFILNVDVLLADNVDDMDENSLQQMNTKSWDPRRYWLKAGMSSVLTSRNLDTQVKIKLDDMALAPSIDIAILNDILTLEGCADSFQSLLNFMNYVSNDGDKLFPKKQPNVDSDKRKEQSTDKTHNTLQKTKEDMLASLDENAFGNRIRQQQQSKTQPSSSMSTSPLILSSDLNLVEGFYLGSDSTSTLSSSRKNISRPNKPLRKHYYQPHRHQKPTEDIIRVLIPDVQELDIIENFYSVNQKKERRQLIVDTRHSLFSVRIRDVDIIWKLYSGYDWPYIRSCLNSPVTSFATNTTNHPRRPSNEPSSSFNNNKPNSRPSSIYSSSFNNNSGDSFSKAELGTSFNRPSSFVERTSPTSNNTHSSPPPHATVSLDRRSSSTVHHLQQHEIGSHNSSDDFHYSSPSSFESRNSFSQTMTPSPLRRHKTLHNRVGLPEIELRIEGICLELDVMAPEEQTCLHAHLAIKDLEIVDNIKTSSWDTLLGYMRSDSPSKPPRETGSDMITIDVVGIKPIKDDDTLEYRLKVNILPLRFYVDQDALNFLVQFFSFNQSLLHSTAGATIASADNVNSSSDTDDHNNNKKPDNDLFFQHVEIHPLHLKIDYKPKYINYDNIKEGQFAELVNLFRLEDAKLNLSGVKLTGIKGVSKLLDRLGKEWLPHIKNTQIPGMVSGISPIRSVVNLGSGVANLVILPIQQYRKDGRIIKGIQKGTQSFAKTTAMELIKLSARLALGTQVILEHADGLLSYGNTTTTTTNASNTTTSSSSSSVLGLGLRGYNDIGNETRDGMASSSISPLSTVIGSRTNDDMVLIITDKNIEQNE
ncbi:unnamed protein product [Cunninghamella echinulata]